jgi:hypothetical protein
MVDGPFRGPDRPVEGEGGAGAGGGVAVSPGPSWPSRVSGRGRRGPFLAATSRQGGCLPASPLAAPPAPAWSPSRAPPHGRRGWRYPPRRTGSSRRAARGSPAGAGARTRRRAGARTSGPRAWGRPSPPSRTRRSGRQGPPRPDARGHARPAGGDALARGPGRRADRPAPHPPGRAALRHRVDAPPSLAAQGGRPLPAPLPPAGRAGKRAGCRPRS